MCRDIAERAEDALQQAGEALLLRLLSLPLKGVDRQQGLLGRERCIDDIDPVPHEPCAAADRLGQTLSGLQHGVGLGQLIAKEDYKISAATLKLSVFDRLRGLYPCLVAQRAAPGAVRQPPPL